MWVFSSVLTHKALKWNIHSFHHITIVFTSLKISDCVTLLSVILWILLKYLERTTCRNMHFWWWELEINCPKKADLLPPRFLPIPLSIFHWWFISNSEYLWWCNQQHTGQPVLLFLSPSLLTLPSPPSAVQTWIHTGGYSYLTCLDWCCSLFSYRSKFLFIAAVILS